MTNKLRKILLGLPSDESSNSGISVRGVAPPAPAPPDGVSSVFQDRQWDSKAVEQFLNSLQGDKLRVLDFTAACQENMDTILALGHKPVPDDFLYMLDECFGGTGDFFENQKIVERQDKFMQMCLQYDDWTFDGALVWDSLVYLTPELMAMTLDHLFGLLRPGALLLATFHTGSNGGKVPAFTYRMEGRKKLRLTPRGERRAGGAAMSISDIEKLFTRFSSVKFFGPREGLREVIVKR